jgi:hypothetical protein
MLISVKRWRVAKVSMLDLQGAAGFGAESAGAAILDGLRKTFGPLGPRIRFFFPEPGIKLAIVGIEVEAFDIRADGIPFAGIVHADPLDSLDLAREEGALRAELERLGLRVEVEELEWRFSYDVKD